MQLRKQSNHSLARCAATLTAAMILALTLTTTASASSHEKPRYNFTGSPDASPNGALVADFFGNLYGTTASEGSGTVFELSPPTTSGGAWTRTVIYSFLGGDTDGAFPYGTLIFSNLADNAGDLFGTTSGGGPDNRGTVFELSPPATSGGAWTESVIYFLPSDLSAGYNPAGKLAMDDLGNIWGLASNGGSHVSTCDCGTIFSLHFAGGVWIPQVMHDFGLTTGDGANPVGDLTIKKGVLYGMTQHGGTFGKGTIFQLAPISGAYAYSVLHSFSGGDGDLPFGRLVLDAAGNLYGVTVNGGGFYCDCGTVYELSPPSVTGSGWQLAVIHSFQGALDGANPSGPLVFDKAGNIYGTARNGGLKNKLTSNNGTVFELSPPTVPGGAWTKTNLHEFSGTPYNDGSQPNYGLIVVNGKFFGTTAQGGTANLGTVFSLVIAP